MLEILRGLWAIINTPDDDDKEGRADRNGKLLLMDPMGHPLFIHPDDLDLAIRAELIDAAAAQEDRLVYEEGWEWPINLWGLRNIIAAAHNEPDPDMALLHIITSSGFQDYKPDEDDEQ